jgi:guanylate kinase
MNQLDLGHNVLTDIDVVGAKNIKKLIPSAILIFVAPPSFKVLKQRLTQRKTDSEEEAETRLDRAKSELAEMGLYDFIIINDDFSKALDSLIDIVNLGVGPKKVDKEKLWEDFFLDEDS